MQRVNVSSPEIRRHGWIGHDGIFHTRLDQNPEFVGCIADPLERGYICPGEHRQTDGSAGSHRTGVEMQDSWCSGRERPP